MYEVEYVDGEKSTFYANLVSENMFAHIDEEGNHHLMMYKVTDHWFNEAAVKSKDDFLTTSSGTKFRRWTTQGVSLCIKYYDRNTTWVALKGIKEAYPIQLAQ